MTTDMRWTKTWELELALSRHNFAVSNQAVELRLTPVVLGKGRSFHLSLGNLENESDIGHDVNNSDAPSVLWRFTQSAVGFAMGLEPDFSHVPG